MKTERLIGLLAADAEPVPRLAATRRLGLAWLLALPLVVAIVVFDYGLRRDLAQVSQLPMFWVKLLVPLSIAIAGFIAAQRLGRPGVRAGKAWWGVGAPIAALWSLALVVWLAAPAGERPQLLFGQTWRSCAWSIGFISLPMFVASLGALKSLAPTRPALAGAAAGTLAGGTAAAVYALHCPELTAPFLAVWYVLGMALPAALGASVGARLLRW